MRTVRVALLALSVAAIAWFVLGARQARQINQATAIVQASSVSAAQARRANQLLDSASTLNPDRQILLLRAAVDIDRNDNAPARALLEHVTRLEPDNLTAWELLVQMGGNPIGLRERAFHRLAQLDPPVGHGH